MQEIQLPILQHECPRLLGSHDLSRDPQGFSYATRVLSSKGNTPGQCLMAGGTAHNLRIVETLTMILGSFSEKMGAWFW
jgi:hypothetical protein